jgi:FxsC-like protein
MSYYFFFSYAHDDNKPSLGDGGGLVKNFYDDLSDYVRRKARLSENEVSFFDEDEIPLGAEWSLELSEAIQTSKIFVGVYSPTYFRKPFCGQEWTVFNLRQQAYAKAHGGKAPQLMIPVLWEKEIYVSRDMPAALKKYQYDHGVFGNNYPRYGLRQIMSDANLRKSLYADFLDKFSDKLIEAVETHREMPRFETAKRLEEVEPVFPLATTAAAATLNTQRADANPRYVKFVFVVGRQKEMHEAQIRRRIEYYRESGAEWTPYLPDVKQQIDLLVKRIALDRDFSPEDTIDLNDDLLHRIEEVKNKNQIVVIVVDSWSLKIPNYREWMKKFDGKSFLNCIVVIPWINDDETIAGRSELNNFVMATFPTRILNNSPNFLDCVDSVDKLNDQLGRTLCETKQKIIRLANVEREIDGAQPINKPVINATLYK